MAAEYQEPDWPVVDYEAYCLDLDIIDTSRFRPLFIRGPRPASLEPGEYFVCLGAAQTFGRFCPRPFPTILADQLSLSVLNISHGGAGPSFFNQENGRLLEYVNRARFVIVQVMSGRSEGNSLFESHGVGHYTRRSDGAQIGCDEAFEELLRTCPKSVVATLVRETRENWLQSYRSILSKVNVPKILFWFSTRKPRYRQNFGSVHGLFGTFPQLIDHATLTKLRAECDYFASCISKRGLPQKLIDRNTGEPTTILDPWTNSPWQTNWYYPSPQMHQDAAKVLAKSCRLAAGIMSRN